MSEYIASYLLAALLATTVIGCGISEFAARDKALKTIAATPTTFSVPADSANLIWTRARVEIVNRGISLDTDTLMQTFPASGANTSPGLTVRRMNGMDSVTFVVTQMSNQKNLFASQHLAYYMRTGEDFDQLEARLNSE